MFHSLHFKHILSIPLCKSMFENLYVDSYSPRISFPVNTHWDRGIWARGTDSEIHQSWDTRGIIEYKQYWQNQMISICCLFETRHYQLSYSVFFITSCIKAHMDTISLDRCQASSYYWDGSGVKVKFCGAGLCSIASTWISLRRCWKKSLTGKL